MKQHEYILATVDRQHYLTMKRWCDYIDRFAKELSSQEAVKELALFYKSINDMTSSITKLTSMAIKENLTACDLIYDTWLEEPYILERALGSYIDEDVQEELAKERDL